MSVLDDAEIAALRSLLARAAPRRCGIRANGGSLGAASCDLPWGHDGMHANAGDGFHSNEVDTALRNAAYRMLDEVARLRWSIDVVCANVRAEIAARVAAVERAEKAEAERDSARAEFAAMRSSAGHAAAVAVHGDPLAGAVGTIGPRR